MSALRLSDSRLRGNERKLGQLDRTVAKHQPHPSTRAPRDCGMTAAAQVGRGASSASSASCSSQVARMPGSINSPRSSASGALW